MVSALQVDRAQRIPAQNGTALFPLFAGYRRHPLAWDELFSSAHQPHPHNAALVTRLGQIGPDEFQQLRASADLVFLKQGITFSV